MDCRDDHRIARGRGRLAPSLGVRILACHERGSHAESVGGAGDGGCADRGDGRYARQSEYGPRIRRRMDDACRCHGIGFECRPGGGSTVADDASAAAIGLVRAGLLRRASGDGRGPWTSPHRERESLSRCTRRYRRRR